MCTKLTFSNMKKFFTSFFYDGENYPEHSKHHLLAEYMKLRFAFIFHLRFLYRIVGGTFKNHVGDECMRIKKVSALQIKNIG